MKLPEDIFYIPSEYVKFKECRNCRHWHSSVNSICGSHIVKNSYLYLKPYENCFCQNYASMDNLEYLEHLYENKQRQRV